MPTDSTLNVEAVAIDLFIGSSFLVDTDREDFIRCDSPVSTFLAFYGFALLGRVLRLITGTFFYFSADPGGLRELDFDFVLRLSEGVWYFVFNFAPPIAEQNTA